VTTLRLFVALELSPEAVRVAGALRDGLDPQVWRLLPDDALHLTLAFLGARPEADAAPAAEVLAGPAGPAPRLAFGPPVLLPPRRPRALALGVADLHGELAPLQARVSAGLAAAGLYAPEARPFRPHVTLARLRPRARAGRELPPPPAPVAFTAPAVTLFASRLHPSGARYEPLARVALVPAAVPPEGTASPSPP